MYIGFLWVYVCKVSQVCTYRNSILLHIFTQGPFPSRLNGHNLDKRTPKIVFKTKKKCLEA